MSAWRAIAALLGCLVTAAGGGPPLRTDAVLVTALDVSDSIMRHEEWLEFEGLARAVTDPAFLKAVAAGPHGGIGFAVFVWSSGRRPEPLVPWTVLRTGDDAHRIATSIRQGAIDRSGWERRSHGPERSFRAERRTDLSAAIDLAYDLMLGAPYRAPRRVINICANGADNVGPGPRQARDRALAAGIVINALVLAPRPQMAAYFDREVRGGPGSFSIEVSAPEHVAAAMLDKLLRDLTAGRSSGPLAAAAL
jgi:hypothetical protein